MCSLLIALLVIWSWLCSFSVVRLFAFELFLILFVRSLVRSFPHSFVSLDCHRGGV